MLRLRDEYAFSTVGDQRRLPRRRPRTLPSGPACRRRHSNEAVQAGTISFTLKSSSGTVAGSASYNSTTSVTTFTPTSALAYNTTYTATISGAQNASSVSMTAPFSWSFTTDAAPPAVTGETPASGASTAWPYRRRQRQHSTQRCRPARSASRSRIRRARWRQPSPTTAPTTRPL